MKIKIIKKKITKEELKKITREGYGNILKAVVDIKKEIMVLGGEFHADANTLLIKQGSEQKNLWGINIYPDRPRDEWLEFVALINIRPSSNNRSMEIESQDIREKIKKIIDKLIR